METEVQRGEMTCPRSHSQFAAEPGLGHQTRLCAGHSEPGDFSLFGSWRAAEPGLIWAGLSLSTIPAAPGLGLGRRSGRWKVPACTWDHGGNTGFKVGSGFCCPFCSTQDPTDS